MTRGPHAPTRRRRRWFAAATLLLATVVALAIGEFGARWHHEGSLLEACDSITGLRWAAATGAVAPLVADPDLGFKLNPAVDGVDELGLRHRDIASDEPAGQRRVLLLGDSVAFPMDGFFADLATHLATRSPNTVEAINGAVHGYTTWQQRRFLERDLLGLQPDLVVLQYCCNDNHRFLHRLTSKGRRLLTFDAMAELQPEGDGLLARMTRASYLVYSLRQLLLARRHTGVLPWDDPILAPAFSSSSWPMQEDNLRAMRDALRGVGGRFVVVAIPIAAQLDPSLLQREPERILLPQRELAGICARLEVPLLDVHATFVAHRGEGLFLDGLHLTAAGHRLVGRALVEFLEGLAPGMGRGR